MNQQEIKFRSMYSRIPSKYSGRQPLKYLKWSGVLDRINAIVLQAVFRKLSAFNHFVWLTLKELRMDQSNLRKTACKTIKLVRSNKPDYFISSILKAVSHNFYLFYS